jgi:hypothetical protein
MMEKLPEELMEHVELVLIFVGMLDEKGEKRTKSMIVSAMQEALVLHKNLEQSVQ